MQVFGTVRDDASVVVVNCAPADYSASRLAHAVEDCDVHLVDLLSFPEDDHLRVMLRVRCLEPEGVVQSLERYGYSVVETSGSPDGVAVQMAAERLLELQALMNV